MHSTRTPNQDSRRISKTGLLAVVVSLLVLSAGVASAASFSQEWQVPQSASSVHSGAEIIPSHGIAVTGDGNGNVEAHNLNDGSLAWSITLSSFVSEIAYSNTSDILYAAQAPDGVALALDPADGSIQWQDSPTSTVAGVDTDGEGGAWFGGNIDGYHYDSSGSQIGSISSADGAAMAYSTSTDTLFTASLNRLEAFNASTGERIWLNTDIGIDSSNMKSMDGKLYAVDESGDFRKYSSSGNLENTFSVASGDGTGVAVNNESDRVFLGTSLSGSITGYHASNMTSFASTSYGSEKVSGMSAESVGGSLKVAAHSNDATAYFSTGILTESYSISGQAVTQDGEGISGVTVETNTTMSTTTDSGGFYSLSVTDGTYTLTASKEGYRNVTETVTVDGNGVEQDFQLVQFNQSINLDTKRYIEHGQRADYRVIVQNDTGRHNITGDATVTSGDTSVVTVDTAELQLQATTDISVNQRTPVTAEWEDSEGNVYSTQTNVTVANATVENIGILPTWTKTSASLGDETLQLIIVATMIGAAAALLASSFAGLSAATGITVLGWFAGMASDGILIVSFLFAVFVGLNLTNAVDIQVRQ